MNKLKICAYLTIGSASIAITVLSIVFASSGGDIPFDYGIVLDAGSSHTSVNLYKWSGNKNEETGEIIEVDRCSQEPGISSIDNPRLAGYNVLNCTVNVTRNISPDENRKLPIPIYLGATAGMRILREENPERSGHILDAIEKTFSCLLTDFQIKQIDIITGKDEALSAWVSSNYIAGNLANKTDSAYDETFGIIDMGEASAQIAYQVSANDNRIDRTTIIETDLAVVRLFGVSRTVRLSTNLCWGAGEAYKRYLASLIVKDQKDFAASCLNKNFELTLLGNAFENKLCYERKSANIYDGGVTYRFTGLGDPEKCKTEISLLFSDCNKTFTRCPTVETEIPPLNMTFFAMSTYYYTVRLLKGNETMSLANFLSKASKFCRLTMDEALTSQDYDKKSLRYFSCFNCFYVPVFLREIYKFKDEDWNRLRFLKTFKGTDLGWSLGFMVNATNALPQEALTPKTPVTRFFVLLLVMFILMLLCGISIMMIKYVKNNKVYSVNAKT